MKIIFKISLMIALLLVTTGSFAKKLKSGPTPVSQHGQLQVIGTQLCDQQGKPVVLRGVSMGWSNEWGAYYNKQVVHTLAKEWHISLIRAAMGVNSPAKKDKCYLNNPEYAMSCVTAVVDQAIKEGIYVIIDFHSHELLTKEAINFFTLMSQKYKNYPNVIYEVFNEPIKQPWADIKSYAETVIDVIRQNDPKNVILVGTSHWDQDIHLAAADPIQGRTNFMYTMHFYAATHKKWLRDRTDAAIAKGLPVFVSECAGMEASGDGYLDTEEWKAWVDWMESRQISWACWSVTPKVETCSMLVPDAPTNGKWTEEHIKPWGKVVKDDVIRLNTTVKSK